MEATLEKPASKSSTHEFLKTRAVIFKDFSEERLRQLVDGSRARSFEAFALRVSNFLSIVLLFFVGRMWADYTGSNRLATASAIVAIGLMLVTLAALLGG